MGDTEGNPEPRKKSSFKEPEGADTRDKSGTVKKKNDHCGLRYFSTVWRLRGQPSLLEGEKNEAKKPEHQERKITDAGAVAGGTGGLTQKQRGESVGLSSNHEKRDCVRSGVETRLILP